MEYARFRQIIEDYLFPMFPGTHFSGGEHIGKSLKLVSDIHGRTGFKVTPSINAGYHLVVRRGQRFTIEEKRIFANFVSVMVEIDQFWDKPYRDEIARTFLSRVVAESVSDKHGELITKIITLFSDWAEQTYEGQRISSAIGIENSRVINGVSINELVGEDFFKVLSNGHDTILRCSSRGVLLGHEALPFFEEKQRDVIAPIRLTPIASWAKSDKVAIVVNRNGEILIFSSGQLQFAKRRGLWRYFSHEAVITQMSNSRQKSWDPQLKRAIYLSALDVSFSRSGGCVGIARRKKRTQLISLVNDDDLLSKGMTSKTTAMDAIIPKNKKFHELDRLLRHELVAIDGATVLDTDGTIRAVGAILKIRGGSTGGGRTAAAKSLSKYGMGIKVSNDGYIDMYIDKDKEPLICIG